MCDFQLTRWRFSAINTFRLFFVLLLVTLLLSCSNEEDPKFTTCASGGEVPPSTDPLNLSRTPCSSASPVFTQGNSIFYVAWQEVQVGNGDIFWSRSTDQGTNFSTAENLTDNTAFSGSPAVAAEGANIFLAWEELSSGSSTEVFLKQSTDSGLTFGTPLQISDAAGSSPLSTETHSARSPAVAVSGNTVWLAWEENIFNLADPSNPLPKQSEILVRISTDGGATFGSAQGISRSSNCPGGTVFGMFSHFPFLTVSGTNLYVVWQENTEQGNPADPCDATTALADILFSSSTSSAPTSFSLPKPLTLSAGNTAFGTIAAGNNVIHVAWSELLPGTNNTEIYYSRSTDGGATFSDPPAIISNTTETSGSPNMFAEGDNLIVVWEEATPELKGIVRIKSTDGGKSFSAVLNASQTSGSARRPKVILNTATANLIWVDASIGNPEIVFRAFPF